MIRLRRTWTALVLLFTLDWNEPRTETGFSTQRNDGDDWRKRNSKRRLLLEGLLITKRDEWIGSRRAAGGKQTGG